jgi:TP901 family phage tail tape measure protein
MSEKTFGVVLSARVDQYMAAMRRAKDASGAFSSETKANLEKAGATMSHVGRTMTAGVTLPLVGLGVAAVKMSTDFERSFAQMVGLAGIPAGEVDHLKTTILNLSKQTGVSAQELADALYFASSAGLSTADAMDAVNVAAHASATGLGSAKDVVGLVASALSSYGSENLSAAEATDILTKTIKVGRAEPAELAGTLGRILPIASQLGVSFSEVGGATAYLSNIFGDTNRTVTALSGFLAKLVAPTQQGRKALQDMGTSVEELQATIKEKGLLGALELLRSKGFAGNQQALRALFDDIEGFQGALALLNDKSGTLTSTFAAVQDHAGALGDAFNVVAQTDGFKMRQAFESLKVSMIQAGDVIVPLITDVVGWVGKLAGVFGSLPGPVQMVLLGFLGLAAAAGPLIMIAGSVVRNLQTLQTVSSTVGSALSGIGPYLLGAAAAAVIAYGAYQILTSHSREVAARTKELIGPLRDATDGIIAEYHAAVDAAGSAEGFALAHKALSKALTETGENGQKLTLALGQLGLQSEDAARVLIMMKDDPVRAMGELGKAAGLTTTQTDQLGSAALRYNANFLKTAAINGMIPPGLLDIALAMNEIQLQAELNLATACGDVQAALVRQAREQAGAGATAEQVYEKYVELATASDDLAAAGDKSAAAQKGAAAATGAAGDAAAGAAVGTGELSDAQVEAQKQAQGAIDAWTEYRKVLTSTDWGAASVTGATKAFDSYREGLFGLGNFAQEKTAAFQGFYKAIGDGALDLDTATEAGAKQQDALEGVAKILDSQFADAWSKANGNLGVARASMKQIADGALAELGAGAHLSADEVQKLADTLGLTPKQIETRIKLAGAAEAQLKLQLLQGVISTLPREVQQKIAQQVIAGDWKGAVKTGQDWMNNHPVTSDVVAAANGAALKNTQATISKGTVGPWWAHIFGTADKPSLRGAGKDIQGTAGQRYKANIKTGETGAFDMGKRIWGQSRQPYKATIRTGEIGSFASSRTIWDYAQRPYRATIHVGEQGGAAVQSRLNWIASTRAAWFTGHFNDNGVSGALDRLTKPRTVLIFPRVGGPTPMFASGTRDAPGGLAIINEQGPELIALPRHSQVFTAAETRSMMATGPTMGASTSGPTSIDDGLHIHGDIVTSDFKDAIRQMESLEWRRRVARGGR